MAAVNKRAEEIQTRRRRRTDDFDGRISRLGVDDAIKDENYVYRWINDDKGRLETLTTLDDWDFVADQRLATDEKNKSVDTRIRREVGRNSVGGVMYAYLCRKRRDFQEEDDRRKSEQRAARREQRIVTQDTGQQGGVSDDPTHTYIPGGVQAQIDARPRIRRA